MKIARILATALAALGLFSGQGAASAREMMLPPSGGSGGPPHDLKYCVREVDRTVQAAGTVNNQYMTRFIKLKNFCGRSFNVTLDVAYQPDPKCKKLQAGKTAEFVYSVEMVYTPPPHEYRRIKEC